MRKENEKLKRQLETMKKKKKKKGDRDDDDDDEEPGAGGVLSQSQLTDKISQEVFSKVVSQLQNVVSMCNRVGSCR